MLEISSMNNETWKKIHLFNAHRQVRMRSGIKEVRSLETLWLAAVWIWMALALDSSCWSMQIDAVDTLGIAEALEHMQIHMQISGEDQLIEGARQCLSLISKDTIRVSCITRRLPGLAQTKGVIWQLAPPQSNFFSHLFETLGSPGHVLLKSKNW